jgi:hypothetical protein
MFNKIDVLMFAKDIAISIGITTLLFVLLYVLLSFTDIFPERICKGGYVHEQYANENFSRPTKSECVEIEE